MTTSEDLIWRGQIKDTTFADTNWLNEPKAFYLGVDACSADSLTIGNLASIMLARRLAAAGWKAIMLVGGATSLVGDPGGKDSERELTPREEIEHNVAMVKSQVQRIFAGEHFILVDNYDWFRDIGYLDFLREVGKHFSMSELVQREYIAERMGQGGSGISYAEFSYNLIQGYDFWYLYQHYGVVLQIGGSDQWGNMLSGVPLIRKKEGVEAHAMSMPLVINKATGKKFGKSEEGAVWLDSAKTSVYKFYQFWLNLDDQGVVDYLKIYTFLSRNDIETLAAQHQANPSVRAAQKNLAYEVTKITHGEEAANAARRATEALFGKADAQLDQAALNLLATELPTVPAGSTLVEALVSTGLAASNGEARRFLAAGAISIDGQKITDDQSLAANQLVKKGKNSFLLVR